MSMSRLSRMTRTTAARGNTVMNSSGNFPIPYGRGTISVTGRGASGSAASGGNYWYDNSTYNYGNPTPPYYSAGNPTPPTLVNGNTNAPVLVPGNPNPGNPYVFVQQYYYDHLEGYSDSNDFYSNTCPAHYGNVKIGAYYSCSYGTNYSPPNADYYVNGNTNAPYYNNNPPNADYYQNNPPNSPVYYAGNVVYNPYVPPTTGASATFGGQTFPGGYGGAATPVTVTVYIPFTNAGAPAVIPANASLSITVIS